MTNQYEIRGDVVAIKLKTASGIEMETLIDKADFERANELVGSWLPRWNTGTKSYYVQGYIKRKFKWSKGRTAHLHRFLYGFVSYKLQVDHIYHDTLDNRRSTSLRIVTPSENMANRRKRNKKSEESA